MFSTKTKAGNFISTFEKFCDTSTTRYFWLCCYVSIFWSIIALYFVFNVLRRRDYLSLSIVYRFIKSGFNSIVRSDLTLSRVHNRLLGSLQVKSIMYLVESLSLSRGFTIDWIGLDFTVLLMLLKYTPWRFSILEW